MIIILIPFGNDWNGGDTLKKNASDKSAKFVFAFSLACIASLIVILYVRYIFWEYILSFLVFAVVFYVSLYCIKRRSFSNKTSQVCEWIFFGIFLISMVFWLSSDIYDGSGLLFGVYFLDGLKTGFAALAAILCGVGLCKAYRKYAGKRWDRVVIAAGILVAACVSRIWYIHYIAVYDLHYDAYFYPVYRVASGKTLYVDFDNIYGCYAYLIAPFITKTGCKAVEQFSLIMCLLVFSCFMFIFYTLYKVCVNKMTAFLGLLAVMWYVSVFFIRQQGNSFYLQYVPHRILFPGLVTAAVIRYMTCDKKKRKSTKIWIHVINIAAFFWNLETGVVCMIAATVIFCMEVFLDGKKGNFLGGGWKYVRSCY